MARRKRRYKGGTPRKIQANGITRTATTPEELQEVILGGRSSSKSGVSVTADSAMRVAAVYSCVRVLAESIAMLPLRLYNVGGDVPKVQAGPLDNLVAYAPNMIHTPFDFKRWMVTCLLLKGNFYALKVAVGTRAGRLLPLHPDEIEPKIDATGRLVYEHRPPGQAGVVKYRQQDILHIRALSTDGLRGMSVIEAAREAVGVGLAAEAHGAKLFSNGAQVGQVLEHPASISEEAAKRLRKSFDDRYAGVDNAHKTVLLEEGMKLSRIGMTSEEVQFIESRKFQRSEIAMFFGVPPHMIGDIERGTSWGSGIEQQGIGFVTYTLRPWLTNITQALGRDLLAVPEMRRLAFGFDTDDLTKADFKTRQEGLKIQKDAGVITAKQWATREGVDFDEEAAQTPQQTPAPPPPENQPPADGGQAFLRVVQ